jgi:hypothetical protein
LRLFKKTLVINLYKKELDNIIEIDDINNEIGEFEIPATALNQINELAILLKEE